jgi:hypothetical protein
MNVCNVDSQWESQRGAIGCMDALSRQSGPIGRGLLDGIAVRPLISPLVALSGDGTGERALTATDAVKVTLRPF